MTLLEDGWLRLVAIHGATEAASASISSNFPMRIDAETVTARAARTRSIAITPDVLADPAYATRDNWVNKVAATLPGIDLAGPTRVPTIEVGAGNEVTITIEWLQPGETTSRKLVTVNRINGTT